MAKKKNVNFTTHKVSIQNQEAESYPNEFKWKALFRGSLLSTTINKHVSYVGLADRRAQSIITINSILIPIAISGGQNELFRIGSIIAVITAIFSIGAALYSIYPKPYSKKKGEQPSLLHFSQIQRHSEERYMDLMREALSDTAVLAQMAVEDLYHISKHIVVPKFYWLKVSYIIFFLGYLIAIASIGIKVL